MEAVLAKGLVASGSGCEGVVRVAGDVAAVLALLDDPHLGETILLTESATATAVVPLLPRIRGLICTSGGTTSHLAIVAREFGLPCVMAAEVGDAALLDGVRVVVAGDGTVARA